MDATRPSLPRLGGLGLVVAGILTAALAAGFTAARVTDATAGDGAGAGPGPGPTVGDAGRDPDDPGGGYAFWGRTDVGDPLRWDPCGVVPFVLGRDGAPPEAEADLVQALGVLAAATGMDLRLVGVTDERPDADRPLAVRVDGRWRWAPVLVAWDGPGAGGIPLGPHDRGIAVPVAVRHGDREAFVTGQVVLNARRTDLRPGFGDRSDAWGATLLHELAHVLGLAHVDDRAQLMAAAPGRGPVTLGAGDRAGLARIGRDAGCVDAPRPAPGLRVGG